MSTVEFSECRRNRKTRPIVRVIPIGSERRRKKRCAQRIQGDDECEPPYGRPGKAILRRPLPQGFGLIGFVGPVLRSGRGVRRLDGLVLATWFAGRQFEIRDLRRRQSRLQLRRD